MMRVLVAMACLVPLLAGAQTHFVALTSTNPVPPYTSWATAATNIQDALDVATNGALVLVSNGVYQTGGRTIGTQSLTNRVAITNLVTVQSVNGPAVTTIKGAWDPLTTNGNAAVRGVQFTAAGALIGFTVTNGATLGANAAFQIDQRGGGILCVVGAVVSNCVIAGNQSSFTGGGVQGGLIYRSTIRGNRAPNGGGARLSSPAGTLFDCIVRDNVATNGGGGISLGTAINTLITGNTAGGSGGGANSTYLVNCTVVSNSAASGGGMFQGSAVNSIVYFNSASNYAGAAGFTNSLATPLPANGVGNNDADPLFASPAAGNYRLTLDSPAFNAGLNSAVVSTHDLDGKPRILNATVDIGAYEFGSAPTSVVTLNATIISVTSAELNGSVNGGGLSASAFFVYQQATNVASTNTAVIDIPDLTNAVPYPATIMVSGITGVVNEVQVTLAGLSHGFSSDLDILLVGPQGQAVILLSDAGASTVLVNKQLIFSDRAPQTFPGSVPGLNYFRPTNIGSGDFFPPPAMTNALATNLAVFAGTDPNGTWSLFIRDDFTGDTGDLAGWSLTFGHGAIATTPPVLLTKSTNNIAVSGVVTGLTVDTTYLFRVAATNELGLATGVDLLFRTPGPPDVETLSPRVTGPYAAVLRGSVSPNLGETVAWFEYGPTTNYGQSSASIPVSVTNDSAVIEFPLALASDADVHFRVVASNSLGVAQGADRVVAARRTHFVALNSPSPTPPYLTWATAATNIQDAIDAANDRALILVSNGVYETGARLAVGLLPSRIAVTNVITVQSVNGPADTILRGTVDPLSTNGPGAVRGAYVISNAVVAGFTLAGGATFSNTITDVVEVRGGGAYLEPGGVLSNCFVIGNQAGFQGGGVFGGNLYHCLIESNRAASGGGVAQPSLQGGAAFRSIIRNNRVASGLGGGMLYGRAADCLIVNNLSELVGGGVAYTELNGCTVAGNTAFSDTGGAYGAKVVNSILYFNIAPTNANYLLDGFFGATNFVHTCTTPAAPGLNNITNDPQFVSLATGDFRLRTNSPCRNTGVNTQVVSTVDAVGSPRIREGVVDMGALEFQPLPVAVTLTPLFTPTGLVARAEVNPVEVPTFWFIEWEQRFPADVVVLTNNAVITINDLTNATPYPSSLLVSGLTGEVFDVEVTMESLSHTRPNDIDMLLQGPQGESVTLMSDVGLTNVIEKARLVFTDVVTNRMTTTSVIVSGAYQPSNVGSSDSFPFPASTNMLGTNLAVFAGTEPNGTWSLFVVDDFTNQTGVITGWSMRVSVAAPRTVLAGGLLDATNELVPVSAVITGLVAGQPYRYRVVASNANGVVTGAYVTLNAPVFEAFVALGSTNPVPPYMTWATAATNIQDALDMVSTGGVVWVSNGVYNTGGREALDALISRVAITNGITVRSVNGPAVTVIEGARSVNGNGFGPDAVRGVYISEGGRLEGFTVRGGSTDDDLNPDGLGGGVRMNAGSISGCIIHSNQALRGGGVYGGAVENSLILGNFALGVGGGAMQADLFNCTVVENQGFETVGGVVDGLVVNSIVVDNRTFTSTNVLNWQSDAGSPIFNHTLTKPLPPGSGNSEADPLFVNAAAGNYRLLPGSPGVNAGTNNFVFGAVDLDGNPRLLGGRVDLGAYETTGADADGDGANDLNEYIADTNPTNPLSFFPPIALTSAPPGQLALVIEPTSTGRVYRVEATTNLLAAPQTWTLVPPEILGNGGPLTIIVTNNLPVRHYRTSVRVPAE